MFKFKCITSYCVDMGNRLYIKAITEDGNKDLIIYGKHTDIDTLTLLDVSGKIKNENRSYLIVDSMNIIDRFDAIRGSFSKLSVAMLFLEIAYRSNLRLSVLLTALNRLKKEDSLPALVIFLIEFLKENGILNTSMLTQVEKEELENILHHPYSKKPNKHILTSLKNKLLKETQKYINQPLNSLKLLKL